MALSKNTEQLEHDKFGGDSRPETYVRTSKINSLVTVPYDYIAATYPTASTEVYTYKSGGSSGTVVGIITVVYTDSTKEVLTSVTKS